MLVRRTLLVLAAGAATISAAPPAHIPVEAFARLPAVVSVRLSPNGRHLAYLSNNETGTFLYTQTIGSKARTPVLRSKNEAGKIIWFAWANDDLLLVGAEFPGMRDRVRTIETRLMGVHREGSEPRLYLEPALGERQPQIADNVISLLRDDSDHVLVSLSTDGRGYAAVYRLNVNTGKKKMLRGPRQPIRDWIVDQQGRVRVGIGYKDGVSSVIARGVDQKKWKKLWSYEPVLEAGIEALGFGLDPNKLYVRKLHEGRNAIFTLDLESGARSLLLHDPEYDIEGGLIRARSNGDVIGVHHEDEEGNSVYWDEAFAGLHRAIDRGLPDTTNSMIDFSKDEQRYVIFAASDVNPGQYFYGNRETQELTLFAETYPELAEQPLSGKGRLTYEARDGLEIEGYLTRPWGDPAPPWPTVILPHGGPAARNYGDFDYMTEFLASRGYGVLQMNFRGSAGYGWEFLQAAFRDFGGQMQNDVTDGAKWMIERGFADPDRICIVGASYGGYASLWGAVKTPDLYRCAISINGVSDWTMILSESRHFINADTVESQLGKRFDLRQISALRRANDIRIPVLLIHSEKDRVVPVEHSRRIAKALKKNDKEYTYLELEHGVHNLTNATNRIACLEAIGNFLATHLDPNETKQDERPTPR